MLPLSEGAVFLNWPASPHRTPLLIISLAVVPNAIVQANRARATSTTSTTSTMIACVKTERGDGRDDVVVCVRQCPEMTSHTVGVYFL